MHLILRTLLIFGLSLNFASAQEEAVEPAPAPEPLTTTDLELPVEHLELRLSPLTSQELESEAGAWRDLVKEKTEEVIAAAIASRTAESGSEEKSRALARLNEETRAQNALLDRFNVVLDAWEAKGGDPAELRKYADAVGAPKVDLKDAASATDALSRWLKSPDGGIKWAFKLGVALVILIATWIISATVTRLVAVAMEKHEGSSELLDRFVKGITRKILIGIGLVVALSTLGINVSALLAVIGGASFIIGFAMQDTLSSFANGFMLMIYQPFDVGDSVEVGGVTGKVDSVSLVSTKIRTFDNKIVLVPNKNVWGQTITNATRSDKRRVDMVFGISYDDDPNTAQALLEKIVSEHELVLDDPEATIKMNELGDSAVNFICRPWAKTDDYWTVFWDITKRVKSEFEANKLSFPYPQQDVHIHQAD